MMYTNTHTHTHTRIYEHAVFVYICGISAVIEFTLELFDHPPEFVSSVSFGWR